MPKSRLTKTTQKRRDIINALYKGEPLPLFIHKHGGDYTKIREFLEENQLGSPFSLEEGRILQVKQEK